MKPSHKSITILIAEDDEEDRLLLREAFVVLTTSDSPTEIDRSYRLGANSFITKPVTFTGLVEMLKSLNNYWFSIVELPPDKF